MGFFAYSLVSSIGQYRPEFAFIYTPPISYFSGLLFGLIFAAMPISFSYMLLILNLAIQFSLAPEVAVFLFCALSFIVFLYSRFAPKESILLLLTVLGFYLKIPFTVPLLTGFYLGLTGIIPVVLGIFIWSFIDLPAYLMSLQVEVSLVDLPDVVSTMLVNIMGRLSSGYEWFFVAFVFTMVILVTYFLSKLSIDHSRDLALLFSLLVIALSYIIGVSLADFDFSIIEMLISLAVSGILIRFIMFFDLILDYKRAESVSFQDDDYYYYVKAIPKINTFEDKRG